MNPSRKGRKRDSRVKGEVLDNQISERYKEGQERKYGQRLVQREVYKFDRRLYEKYPW